MTNLIINPGSATLKCSLFVNGKRIGSEQINGKYGWKDLEKILRRFVTLSKAKESPQISSIGIRYVHGGPFFWKPTLVSSSVLKKLKTLDEFAPLHNPIARELTLHLKKHFPKTPITLVFDTGFHHEIPAVNSTYALPKNIRKKFSIRRYGFHGIVCSSVVHQLKGQKKLPEKLIICHLGSGCSVTAVLNGKSIDTSMGFTPLEGLVMGTRAGDLDPGIVLSLSQSLGTKRFTQILSHESGLKALAGTNNMKEIVKRAKKNDDSAVLALEIFCKKAAKTISSFIVSLGGLDRIVFSGGIGENSPLIRQKICEYLLPFGIKIHTRKNEKAKAGDDFQKIFSKVKLCSLHADEEGEMNRILSR